MTQDSKNAKHFIADNNKVFQRIFNGFTAINEPYIVGEELFLGMIMVDELGNPLNTQIPDSIYYYEEIDKPEKKERNEKADNVA